MRFTPRLLAAFLLTACLVAAPSRAADDEQMDPVDPRPGGGGGGGSSITKKPTTLPPLKPKMQQDAGPSQLLPGATDDGKTPEAADAAPVAPPVEECRRLATGTLVAFDRAVRSKSFTAFHIESLSKQFAAEFSADKLHETFAPFIASDANLAGVENVEPVFDPEPFVDNNLLKLKGFYATRPMRVLFDFEYALESGKWRVHAMTINLRGTPPPMARSTGGGGAAASAAPSDAELAKLVAGTLMEFNAAVKSGDFTQMYAKASTPMRWQTKPAKLKEAFQSFIANGTDIGAIAGAEPQFDGLPKIEGKQMTVSGHYRVLPLFVIFSIDYYREAEQWKLLAVNVNTISPAEFQRDAAAGGGDKKAAPAEPEDGQVDPNPPAMKKGPADPGDGEIDPNPPTMKKGPGPTGGGKMKDEK